MKHAGDRERGRRRYEAGTVIVRDMVNAEP